MGNSEASVHPCESDGSVKVSLCGDCFAHPPDDYLVKGLIQTRSIGARLFDSIVQVPRHPRAASLSGKVRGRMKEKEKKEENPPPAEDSDLSVGVL